METSKYVDGPSIESSMNALQSGRSNLDSLRLLPRGLANQQNFDFYQFQRQTDFELTPTKVSENGFQKEQGLINNKLPFKHIDSDEERDKYLETSRFSDRIEPMIISLSQKQPVRQSPTKSTHKNEINIKEKRNDQPKKKNRYLMDLVENNMIMQSSKKEKQKQQENMRQQVESENIYLKNVYGKYYEQNQLQSLILLTTSQNSQQIQDSQSYNNNNNINKASETSSTGQKNILKLMDQSRERSTTVPINRQTEQNEINYSKFRRQSGQVQKNRLFTFCQVINNNNMDDSIQIVEELEHSTVEKKKKSDRKGNKLMSLLKLKNPNSKQMNDDIRQQFQKKVGIFTKIHRFIFNLKIKSGLKNPKMLNDYRLGVIGDLSFSSLDNSYQQKSLIKAASIKAQKVQLRKQNSLVSESLKKKFQFISKRCSNLTEKIPIIDPSSFKKQLWDLFILFYILLAIMIIPIDRFILYYTQTASLIIQFRKAIYGFFTIVSIIDILSHFCIGIYHQGEVILNRRIIARSYLRGQFLIDVLTFILIVLRFFINDTQLYDIMIFLKLYQIEKILYQQYEYQIIRFNKGHFVQLFQIIITDAFVLHSIASLFVYLGFYEQNQGWISLQGLSNSDWFDIETWFLSAASVLLFVSLLRTIKKLQKVLSDYKKKDKDALKQMRLINIYLRNKNLDQRLKIKIVKYMQFQMNQKSQIPLQQEQYILSLLSEELRQQILIESNFPIIQTSKVFSKFSLSTQQKASTFLEIRTINQNETIFEEGEYSENPYYYYLKEGEIEFFVESVKGNQQILSLQTLKKDNWFGEMSFLTQQERLVGAIAKEKCEVYRISRQDFLDILKEQHRDQLKFNIIEDRLRMNEISILRLKCWSCQSIEHTIKHCPFIHFVPDVEKVILKEKFSLPQKRMKNFMRKRDLKTKAIRLYKLVLQQQKKFKKNNRSLVLEIQKKYLSKKKKEVQRENIFSETNILNEESFRQQLAQVGNELIGKTNEKQYISSQNDLVQQIGAKVVDSFSDLTSIEPNIFPNSNFSDISSKKNIETLDGLKILTNRDRNFSENSKQDSRSKLILFQPPAQTLSPLPVLSQHRKSVTQNPNQMQNQIFSPVEEEKIFQESLVYLNNLCSPTKNRISNQQNNSLYQFSEASININGINSNLNNNNTLNNLNQVANSLTHQQQQAYYGQPQIGFTQYLQSTPQFTSQNQNNLINSNLSLNAFQTSGGVKSNVFYNNLPSIQHQNSSALLSPNHKHGSVSIKTQSYYRGANKAAAIQSQQIFDLQNTNDDKLLDFNTISRDQLIPPSQPEQEEGYLGKNHHENSISPINESDPHEEHDQEISVKRQHKSNKNDVGFGVYSIFNKKNLIEEDQKYKQQIKQSIFHENNKYTNDQILRSPTNDS